MDGLEAVEIPFRDIVFSLRLDAECYGKKYLLANTVVDSFQNTVLLGALCSKITQGSNPTFVEEGLPSLNGKNVYWGKITPNECNFVTEQEFARLSSFALKKDDVVITLKHASKVGRAWIIEENTPKIFGRNIGLIRLKKDSEILPTTLVFYLWTPLVQVVIENMATGGTNGQITLPISAIKKLKIPRFSAVFQNKICGLYEISTKTASQATTLYSTAEALLLSHLGLADYIPSKDPVSVKSLSSSFGVTGRLDSEYYQPKYEEILQTVTAHKNRKLSGLVTIKKSVEPGSDAYGDDGIPFVRVSNLSKFGLSKPDIKIPLTTVQDIGDLYPKKDTILLSKDGSVGIAYKVSEDMQCVTSGAILHLTVKNKEEVLPDYLTLVLNSTIVQMQAERDAGGSIIQHWKPSEVEDVSIPILGKPIQTEIAEKIQQSFALRKQSAELLDLAKTAIEVAIEQGEEKAIVLLRERGVEVNVKL